MEGRIEMDTTTMRVLVVEPGKRPIVKEIRTFTESRRRADRSGLSV